MTVTAEELRTLIRQESDWVPYQGPEGGEGWQNVGSGDVVYDDEPPGSTSVDPDTYFDATTDDLLSALEDITGEEATEEFEAMSAEEIRETIQELATPEEMVEVMEELEDEVDEEQAWESASLDDVEEGEEVQIDTTSGETVEGEFVNQAGALITVDAEDGPTVVEEDDVDEVRAHPEEEGEPFEDVEDEQLREALTTATEMVESGASSSEIADEVRDNFDGHERYNGTDQFHFEMTKRDGVSLGVTGERGFDEALEEWYESSRSLPNHDAFLSFMDWAGRGSSTTRDQDLADYGTEPLWEAARRETGNDRARNSDLFDTVEEDVEVVEEYTEAYRDFLRERYGDTLRLQRGVDGDVAEELMAEIESDGEATWEARTIESWTSDSWTGENFAENKDKEDGLIIEAEIPVDSIMGGTHMGSEFIPGENEMIVALDELELTEDDVMRPDEHDSVETAIESYRTIEEDT